jgi:hypothetical protein
MHVISIEAYLVDPELLLLLLVDGLAARGADGRVAHPLARLEVVQDALPLERVAARLTHAGGKNRNTRVSLPRGGADIGDERVAWL